MAHVCVHTLFIVPTLPTLLCVVLPFAAFFVSLAFSTEWLKAHLFPIHMNVLELKDLIVWPIPLDPSICQEEVAVNFEDEAESYLSKRDPSLGANFWHRPGWHFMINCTYISFFMRKFQKFIIWYKLWINREARVPLCRKVGSDHVDGLIVVERSRSCEMDLLL